MTAGITREQWVSMEPGQSYIIDAWGKRWNVLRQVCDTPYPSFVLGIDSSDDYFDLEFKYVSDDSGLGDTSLIVTEDWKILEELTHKNAELHLS